MQLARTFLIDTASLASRLGSVTLLDSTWYPPNKSGRPEYEQRRIPSALFFDIDGVCDPASPLPHMLPSVADFSRHMAALQVSKARPVVVYDSSGLLAAARCVFTLTAFGHPDVRLLVGGLPLWVAEGRPVEAGAPPPPPPPLPEEPWALDAGMVAGLGDVRAASAAVPPGGAPAPHEPLIVDARPAPRFRGEVPEPRPGLGCGHIPGSRSVPFPTLQRPGFGPLLPPAEAREVLRSAGVDAGRPGRIILSCGSGVTAPIVWLALAEGGRRESVALYDGSFAEWGQPSLGLPIETGPAQ
jgi:thiosulfate/3-mercaptopyruvate sulfurtransferase